MNKGIKTAAALLVLAAAICIGGLQYYRNLPEQRIKRLLSQMEEKLQQDDPEGALETNLDVLALDAENAEALAGWIRVKDLQADRMASDTDNASRAMACDLYEEILAWYSSTEQGLADRVMEISGVTAEESSQKLEDLHREMAASFTEVTCTTTTHEGTGTVLYPDGSEGTYARRYDLVQVTEPYYPYAEKINAVLEEDMHAFMEDVEGGTLMAASGQDPQTDFRDYVGEAGIYAGQGLLSIRMAEVRQTGSIRRSYFCGRTFRLEDAEQVGLRDLLRKTESGLRRLIRRCVQEYLQQEGYTKIRSADVEDYTEDTDIDDFKFWIREDGAICIMIDQDVPFFENAQEILEIPLTD